MSIDPSIDLLEVAPAPRGGRTKRLIVAGAAAAALLLGGVGIGYAVGGGRAVEPDEETPAGEAAASESAPTYVDVPPMIINLRTPGGAARLLKLHVMLVPASASKTQDIEAKLPLLLDSFQPFVRELRPDDLAGSAAVFRVKEELLVRAGGVFGRGVIKDVLIQDMVQQ